MRILLINILLILMTCMIIPEHTRARDNLPEYNLSVTIHPGKNNLRGNVRIVIQNKKKHIISLGELNVKTIKFNGENIKNKISDGSIEVSTGGIVEIDYEVKFSKDIRDKKPVSHDTVSGSLLSNEGISLTEKWYPEIDSLAYFKLIAILPKTFTAISEGDEILESKIKDDGDNKKYVFVFPHPLDRITLAANKFNVSHDTAEGIDIYSYFINKDDSLSSKYLEYTKQYLKMYNDLIGAYPYKRFTIVENILPTGYSMPTYTLLGRDVIRLPFIVKTSLGHEILHQWFGNSVYVNFEKGNWCEGLTSYLSDHYYRELNNEGWIYRKKILQDYQSYINQSNKSSLNKFRGRKNRGTSSIGYGKGAMLFHMLRKHMGDENFFISLKLLSAKRKFMKTSWEDLRNIFEISSESDLEWFFEQWLKRDDVPAIKISKTRLIYLNGIPAISFTLKQHNAMPYKLKLNMVVDTDKGKTTKILNIEKTKETYNIAMNDTPVSISIDPDYDIMRRLVQKEFPPTVSRLLGDTSRILIIDEIEADIYSSMIDFFKSRGFTIKKSSEIKDSDICSSSLLLLGSKGNVYKRLFAGKTKFLIQDSRKESNQHKEQKSGFVINLKKHPLNPEKVVAIVNTDSKEKAIITAQKIFRYGQYSKLEFKSGRNIHKSAVPSHRGINASLTHTVKGVKPEKAISLNEIINNISDKPIIYVGESHSSYEDHRVQLEVIKALHSRGHKVAVGMEMFQRPFQNNINDYLSGKIPEREFLRVTEYYSRWNFDYHLYREIINFAKAKGMPIIALNTDKSIIKKVSKGGLDALTEEERKIIPEDMDMSDADYKSRLKKIFSMHSIPNKKFNNFYQSQILWDETMAHTVAEFMAENPEYKVVALAGIGHVMYGSGIPRRTHRLNGKDYSILINSNISVLDKTVADYVLFPAPLTPPESLLLGIIISEVKGGIKIDKLIHGSIAERAGLIAGDIVTSINELETKNMADIKIALFDRKSGETLQLKISRKGFLFGRNDLNIKISVP